MSESLISFKSIDGLVLKGTLRIVKDSPKFAILFVHGITVDREEDGFYTQFAKNMDNISVISFRFDLRGHVQVKENMKRSHLQQLLKTLILL